MVCKYVQIWLVLVVCNVVRGNFVIKTNINKSAEICGNLGTGNWTRTSDIRINSPLFYRLNYARITGLIIYPLGAVVK